MVLEQANITGADLRGVAGVDLEWWQSYSCIVDEIQLS
jgi:hypothetical protein